MLALGIAITVLLFITGAPIFVAMGVGASLIILFYIGSPGMSIAATMFNKLDSFILLAIPMFILVGQMMVRGGAMKHMLTFFDNLIGHLPGGLAGVCVLCATSFAALSGSSAAAAASLGSLLVTPMTDHGYSKRFAMGLIVAAATLAIMIPPSMSFIAIGFMTGQSVAELFLAGIVPGLVTAAVLFGTGAFIAWKNHYGRHEPVSWTERGRSGIRALPVFFIPVIMMGGIWGGIFTPTEAAAVAAIFGGLITAFVYRSLKWKDLNTIVTESVRVTGIIWAIIAAAMVLGIVVVYTDLTATLTQAVVNMGLSALGYLLLINVVYLVLGMLVETSPLTWITVPVFFPPAVALGVDPVHFAVIVTLNIEIAQVTPPVGINLFVLSGVLHERTTEVIAGTWPFTVALFASLIVITVAPELSLWLPQIFYR